MSSAWFYRRNAGRVGVDDAEDDEVKKGFGEQDQWSIVHADAILPARQVGAYDESRVIVRFGGTQLEATATARGRERAIAMALIKLGEEALKSFPPVFREEPQDP